MTAFVGDILSATAASVTGDPTPSRTWAWLRSGSAISGQTASTYRVTETDIGSSVSALQTETNFIGTTSAASNPLAISSWSPSSLFSASEPGIWLDPSDLTTMFQDRFGSDPVTAPGQFVGLRLDESQGLVLGSELITNGDFSGGSTGWTVTAPGTNTITISGGAVRFVTNGSADTATLSQPWSGATAVGKTYRITFDVLPGSTGLLKITTLGVNSTIGEQTFTATPGAKSFILISSNVSTIGIARVVSASADAIIDNVSVRELPGNHARANADLERGIYGIEPLGGRRNLLTFTEQFENAIWTFANGSATANSTTAPDGTQTAEKAVWNATNGLHWVTQTLTTVASTVYTTSVYLKAAGNDRANIMVVLGGPSFIAIGVNLTTGAITTNTAGTTQASVSSIESVGNGWYRVTMQFTANSTSTSLRITGSSASSWSFAGNDVDGLFVWGAQLEASATATAYQRVVDQYNVTEAGVPTLHYVQYDGSNDGYVTPTIDPSVNAPLGPELVTNGDFSGGSTGWSAANAATIAVTSGVAQVTQTSSNLATIRQSIATVAGRYYRVSCAIASQNGAGVVAIAQDTGTFSVIQQSASVSSTEQTLVSFTFVATASTTFVAARFNASGASGNTFTIDNISVKEVIADKVQVFAGVRKLSDAAAGAVVDLGVSPITTDGSFSFMAPHAAAPTTAFYSRGTVLQGAATPPSYAAPLTMVMSGQGDISGDVASNRINGVQAQNDTDDQGTGNYLANPIYIGRRGGSSFPFNGRDYGIIVRFGGNLSTSNINRAEYYMAQKTGVTL